MPDTLRAAIGRYPHTAALFDGRVASDALRLDLADIPVISRAFPPMVRAQAYDVSEMAVATFVQARAWGTPLVLLPLVMAARYQEGALLTRAAGGVAGPRDLAGRRVGVRAYGQTTAMWLRGILADAHGLDPDSVRWVTFEDAHVPEFADPPSCVRAPAGSDMLAMLRAGELDAAIVGNDVPDDPALRTVFADPDAAAALFRARHGFRPVNHMVVVTEAVAARPGLVAELLRMFAASAALAPPPWPDLDAEASLALALRWCVAQRLVPRALTLAELWAGTPC